MAEECAEFVVFIRLPIYGKITSPTTQERPTIERLLFRENAMSSWELFSSGSPEPGRCFIYSKAPKRNAARLRLAFVAVDGLGRESGEADGDVFGAVGGRRAVADAFAGVCDDGL